MRSAHSMRGGGMRCRVRAESFAARWGRVQAELGAESQVQEATGYTRHCLVPVSCPLSAYACCGTDQVRYQLHSPPHVLELTQRAVRPGQRAVHVSGKWTDADERAEVGSEERGAEQGSAEQAQMGGRQKEGGGATTRRGAVQRRAEQAQARQQEEAEASVVWGAWLLDEGVGGTVCGVTLGLASEAEQRRHTQDGVAN
eukprot:2906815-Rhodomonas_salina.1